MERIARARHVSQIDPATPERIQLLPAGKFSGRDGRGPYLNDKPDHILAEFQSWGMPLLIDYHHQTIESARNAGPIPAAGWGKAMSVEAGEIWTTVEWTARAAQSIQDRELLYLSPVFDYDVNTGRVIRIVQAALLNDPNLYLQAVAARSHHQMDDLLERLCYMLNLPVTSTPEEVTTHLQRLIDQIQADATAMQSLRDLTGLTATAPLSEVVTAMQAKITAPPNPGEFVPREEFTRVCQTLAQLQQQQVAQQVQSLLDQGARDGKISPAMQDWGRNYASQDPEGFANYLKAAPVLVTPQGRNPPAAPATPQEADVNDSDGFQRACQSAWDSDAGIRREFLTFGAYHAYRKADAQGRVKILGARA